VLAGQQLGPVGVGRLDGVDQLGVLGPRAVPALGGDHPVVPLDPAAHDAGQLGEHRVARDQRDLGVEQVVRGHRAAEVIAVGGGLALGADLPEPGHLPGARGPGREPGRLGLQQRAHVEQLIHLLIGGHVHEGALTGPQVDPPLGLHAVQRLADRLPADPELPGQVGLHHVLAGRQLTADDQVDQRVVNRLAQRHRPLQRADHRRVHQPSCAHAAPPPYTRTQSQFIGDCMQSAIPDFGGRGRRPVRSCSWRRRPSARPAAG
jgi:hypothetical protein